MNRPLTLLIIICALLICINYGLTGAATTQSFVTIVPAPIIIPPTPTPAPAPAAPGVPVITPEVHIVHYIGDFAVRRIYPNVIMAPEEIWVYTYKAVNYTIKLDYANVDYAEFTITSRVLHVKIFVGETVQIDSDQNGYADVKITLNSIKEDKADVTFEVPFEVLVGTQAMAMSAVYYVILLLLILLVIDTLIHHKKAKHIFKHIGKIQR